MRYDNLQSLLWHSLSSRRWFLSLPVSLQLAIHERGAWIHTAADLHLAADKIKTEQKQDRIGRY